MPGQRMLHPQQSASRKVTSLTHFEYRVWEQTKLSSDDFGVMPYAAAVLRGDNLALLKETEDVVFAALTRLVELRLLLTFQHQEIDYVCAPVWQTWQQIRYPRTASRPKPPKDILAKCDAATKYLFSFHPGGVNVPRQRRKPSGSGPGPFPESSRAREPRAPANANANANAKGGAGETPPPKPGSSKAGSRGAALSLIRPRDLSAFWEGPVFNVPQKWADKTIKAANGALAEDELTRFCRDLSTTVERDRIDVAAVQPNFLGWLDTELRQWRGSRPTAAERARDAIGQRHLAKVAAIERGDFR